MSTPIIITLSILAAFASITIYNYWRMKKMPLIAESEKIKTLTDVNFQQQIKNGISLVDFWASWCMPCKMMAPILNDVADEVGDKANVCKLNIEQFNKSAADYSVRSIPTMILFKNGKEIGRFVGVKSKDFLLKEINKVK